MLVLQDRARGLIVLLLMLPAITGCEAFRDFGDGMADAVDSVSSPFSSKPKRFKIKVSLDLESWKREGDVIPSLEVDLVGINDSQKPRWENYSLRKYFTPGDLLRRDADLKTLQISSGEIEKTLENNDAIWDKWLGNRRKGEPGKGARWLFVLVNLPGIDDDMDGLHDPRRIIVPLEANRWGYKKEIRIEIKAGSAVLLTPPKPD